jgi:acylphosphatase
MKKQERVIIKVKGWVQGVGFRYAAREEAQKLKLTGVARNEHDGSVYIEAQGKDVAIQEFIAWCRKGPMGADVEHVEHEVQPELGVFEKFGIE